MSFKPVMRLEFLESIRSHLFAKLLEPYRDTCTRYGIILPQLEQTSNSFAWDAKNIYQLIHREYPQPLTSILLQMRDLSEDPDVDYFRNTLVLEPANPPWTAAERALLVHLQNPALFQKSHISALPIRPCQFVEFAGSKPSTLDAEAPERILELRNILAEWFDQKHCTNYCEVYALQTNDEVRWGVIHGRRPRSQGKIKRKNNSDPLRKIDTFFPDQHDLAILSLKTGRLLLNARSMDEVELYRRHLGEVYWGSTDYFAMTQIYSLKPFQLEGESIFLCGDIDGVERIEVRQIDFRKPHAKSVTFRLGGRHLCQDLSGTINQFLKSFSVHSMKIACFADKNSDPQLVTIKPPNRIAFDMRTDHSAAMKFLIAKGMMSVDVKQASLFGKPRR